MIITALARHAGQSLRFFLDSLEGNVSELSEYRRLTHISRVKIDGQKILDSHNIKSFSRLGRGMYRFDFIRSYENSHYSINLFSNGLDVLVVDHSADFLVVQCLKDAELSIICTGVMSHANQ